MVTMKNSNVCFRFSAWILPRLLLNLFELKTKCNLKVKDVFVWFRFKMYLQLLKTAEKISYFFIRTLAKQNETQGAFTNMINTLRFTRY